MLGLATLGFSLSACSSDDTVPPAASSSLPQAESSTPQSSASGLVQVLATDLQVPWSVAFHGHTALISERDSARILELTGDGTTREVGVIGSVAAAGEAGLLGLAIRGDDLYVYSTGESENRIQRYPLTGKPGSFGLGEPRTVLGGLPKANWHSGGRIAFGPDGMLYATVGDTYRSDSAQDLDVLSGKILRIMPNGEVPVDNPFEDSYVYSYGHRNPQGLAWDEQGTMYSAEFGQDTWDELNVIESGGNYGWPEAEGSSDNEDYIDPVQQWAPSEASPSGIAVHDGSIWIANLRGERLREVPLDSLGSSTEHLVSEFGRLRAVVPAPDGTLWILTNNTDGNGQPSPQDDQILSFRQNAGNDQ